MKKSFLILSLIFAFFFEGTFNGEQLFAKSKKQISKKYSKKGKNSKKKKFGKKQTLEQSLNRLHEYFPAFDAENNEFDYSRISQIELNENTPFADYANRVKLLENLNDWLTVPYRHAGRSKRGIDCSNFTSVIASLALGISIPSSPETQSKSHNVKYIHNLDDMQFGDLIFFSGRNKKAKRLGHVGFYLGNGLFAHSSSGRGVIYTHISESYYTQRFRGGGRIIDNSFVTTQSRNNHKSINSIQ